MSCNTYGMINTKYILVMDLHTITQIIPISILKLTTDVTNHPRGELPP